MHLVKLFGDWDNDSLQMTQRLQQQTRFMSEDFKYKDIQFVTDDSYTNAVCFNFPEYDLLTPPDKNVGLVLEPPEIIDVLYPGKRRDYSDKVSMMYSFADDPDFEPAYGMGFATVPRELYEFQYAKPHAACMIVSNKRMTAYHARRHEIKEALMASDLDIHFYGRGMSLTDDPRVKGEIPGMKKHLVLDKYRFTIDFENSDKRAVTDKYFDPILCNAVPISNAEILREIAPENCFEYIGFDWPMDYIIQRIGEIICQPKSEMGQYIVPLSAARHDILIGNLNLTEWIYQRVKEMG